MQDQFKVNSTEETAIVAAVKDFLKQSKSPVLNPVVTVENLVGEHARVKISAPGGEAEPIFGFLRQKGGAWSVLDLGTFFEPSYYDQHGVPKAMRI
jgi:hypothetical protein